MGVVISERLIRGTGTVESDWQAWFESCPVPTSTLPAFLSADARLVVVAPHPDDEVLACGALLSMHAERGGASLLVALTDGEASHAGTARCNAQQLAAERRAERAEGLSRLGVPNANVLPLALPDGQVGQHADRLAHELSALLQPGDVVVSTWRLDGHPDHDAAGRAAAQACAIAGCRLLEAPVWMWHWAAPGDPRVPWHRLQALALHPQALARKQAALTAHVSQLSPRDAEQGPVLGDAILARARRRSEYFFI